MTIQTEAIEQVEQFIYLERALISADGNNKEWDILFTGLEK